MIIAWAQRFDHFSLHGVINLNSGGSLLTACSGRWPITDPYAVWPVDGRPADKPCGRCEEVWNEQQKNTVGLHALVHAAPYAHISRAVEKFALELGRFNKADVAGFEWWLGPCAHGRSPITRCATCTPEGLR